MELVAAPPARTVASRASASRPLAVVARAVVLALRDHPTLNSSWDEATDEVVTKHYVNLGIAVAGPRGLVVPNVKDAQELTLRELAAGACGTDGDAPTAARFTADDLRGGTITITNVGVFGVDAGVPILNPGEAAILAVGVTATRPWEFDGDVALRHVVTLSLAFDHRLVDGQAASLFPAVSVGRRPARDPDQPASPLPASEAGSTFGTTRLHLGSARHAMARTRTTRPAAPTQRGWSLASSQGTESRPRAGRVAIARPPSRREGGRAGRRTRSGPQGGHHEDHPGRHVRGRRCPPHHRHRSRRRLLPGQPRRGAAPLCQSDGSLAGIVTNRDIVAQVVAQGRDPRQVSLAEFAGPADSRWPSMSTAPSKTRSPSCAVHHRAGSRCVRRRTGRRLRHPARRGPFHHLPTLGRRHLSPARILPPGARGSRPCTGSSP